MNDVTDVTGILDRINSGDQSAAGELLALVYQRLRSIAAAKLRGESPEHTFQTADLVNEACLRLLGKEKNHRWQDRGHFFAAAAEAMRCILVDHARRKQSQKRGAGVTHVQLDESFVAEPRKMDEILMVHEALEHLEHHDPRAARLVKLRYFVGMKHYEAAESMEIARREADGLWAVAKTYLYRWINR